MTDIPDFQRKQYALAAHIRDPENVAAPPGIEDRRMAVYRELFFNNIRGLLAGTFPVLRKLHSDGQWQRFIRQFMQKHRAKTPYFLQLPQEFLSFLQSGYEAAPDDYPFLAELAHYEYIELALSISTATDDLASVDPCGDLLLGTPEKSSLAWVYAYSYPVHRISKEFLPDKPSDQPNYLAVHRLDDDKVSFMELNPVSAGLLNAIEENDAGKSGEQLLRALAASINYPDVEALVRHGKVALDELRQLGILIGTRRTPGNRDA